MIAKASYLVLATASLGLLMFEAPRGKLLTSKPERGKVEQKANPNQTAANTNSRTVRSAYFVFICGSHGGK
jgi:hypothetical protein